MVILLAMGSTHSLPKQAFEAFGGIAITYVARVYTGIFLFSQVLKRDQKPTLKFSGLLSVYNTSGSAAAMLRATVARVPCH